MKKVKKLYLQQKKRYFKHIFGTAEKPRLSVFRSNNHIYAQLINDLTSTTSVFVSTLEKTIVEKSSELTKMESAFLVGQLIATKAIQFCQTKVVFDRGNRPYHGRIKSVAEGARKQGLVF